MFGRTAAEVMGQPVQIVVAGGLQASCPAREIRLPATAPTVRQTLGRCELTGLRANGAPFPLEAAVSCIDVGGKAICTAVLQDKSDQVRALDALRRSEQALADTFANAPIGIMCVTPDGRVERVNQTQLDLLERSAGEVIDRAITDLHVNREVLETLLARVARGETVRDFHVQAATTRGLRHLLVDANGVWERGTLVRSRWFVRDITSRISLENQILSFAENERQRIGQDLHDDVCQQLVAIEYMVEALAAGLQAKSPEFADQAHHISFHLRAAADRTRDLARGLAPSLPDQPEGLMTALREFAERTTRIFHRECVFECPKPVLSPDSSTTIHLFRIAQEAVGNALKHAQAQRITIRLFVNGPDLVLGVSDDGNGALPEAGRLRGMGLRVMQYRTGVIGGTLVIQRVPNQGTSVICTVKAGATGPAK